MCFRTYSFIQHTLVGHLACEKTEVPGYVVKSLEAGGQAEAGAPVQAGKERLGWGVEHRRPASQLCPKPKLYSAERVLGAGFQSRLVSLQGILLGKVF